MSIGNLNKRCRFERNEPTAMPGGGEMENYVPLVTTLGYLKTSSGSRTLDSGEQIIFNSATLVCRLQAGLEHQLDSSVRVLVDNRFFSIADWQKEDEKRYYYKFSLKEMK